MDAREGVAFLTGSDGRVAVLRALAESPCRPCELGERTDASRTAIHRSLSGFEERGWVRKRDERYALTATGRHVFEQYDDLATAVHHGDRFSGFLSEFRLADDLPFPFEGEVCVSTPTEPQVAADFFLDNLPSGADSLRGFSPVLTQDLVETFEPTVRAGTTVELVYDEVLARRALEAYPETMELAMASESVTIHVVEESIRSGLALFDDQIFLKAYGPRGGLRACLHSTDQQLLDWGDDWFDRKTAETESLSQYAPDIDPA
jgi:predicted transcriptional regulator